MNRNPRRALIVAALLTVGAGACTDTTELPITTITDTNYFDDPSSYRALLAKIYAGLAVSGQQGPAGNGTSRASTRDSPSTSASTGRRRSCRPTRR